MSISCIPDSGCPKHNVWSSGFNGSWLIPLYFSCKKYPEGALKKAGATHCCELVDTGRSLGFNYIVMTLVGSSLSELRKSNKVKSKSFSMGCAISIGLQCLEAIQELHNSG
uniref:Protein kinase domain-containing protein n=1 Tax=Heterorhabditis bacteriophora TaxID=37862 RepID=A0A1I7X3Z2_HETBA